MIRWFRVILLAFASGFAMMAHSADGVMPVGGADDIGHPSEMVLRKIVLGDATYAMPAAFFDPPDEAGERRPRDMLFQAWLPDMVPLTGKNYDALTGGSASSQRVRILVQASLPGDPAPLMGRLMSIYRVAISEPLGRGDAPAPEVTFEPGPDGSRRARIPHEPTYPQGTPREVFIDGVPESMNTILICWLYDEARLPYPSCRMTFMHRKATFTVTFNRSYLEEWRNVRSRTMALFERYNVTSGISE